VAWVAQRACQLPLDLGERSETNRFLIYDRDSTMQIYVDLQPPASPPALRPDCIRAQRG
jgi:hypothetical protein